MTMYFPLSNLWHTGEAMNLVPHTNLLASYNVANAIAPLGGGNRLPLESLGFEPKIKVNFDEAFFSTFPCLTAEGHAPKGT